MPAFGSIGDMRYAWIACHAGSEDAIAVAVPDRGDAVSGHQDRTAERVEFLCLFPPRAAIISNQVLVLLQFRISIGGQHLAVGVNVDPSAFSLLEQLLEVHQVMPANQNTLARLDAKEDLCRFRIAVATSVGGIQQCHTLNAKFTGFLDHCKHFCLAKLVIGSGLKRFLHEC